MGRSRRGSGAGYTARPASSGPSRSSPPPPPPPRAAAPPMQQHGAMGGAPMGYRGPGLMGTMAASAAGAVAGNALAHHMFGPRNPPATQEDMQMVRNEVADTPCAGQYENFAKCMDANGNNAPACEWAWGMVAQCRQQFMPPPQQQPQYGQYGQQQQYDQQHGNNNSA